MSCDRQSFDKDRCARHRALLAAWAVAGRLTTWILRVTRVAHGTLWHHRLPIVSPAGHQLGT